LNKYEIILAYLRLGLPGKSTYKVESPLYFAADSSAAAAITVHKIGRKKSVCNVWERSKGKWRRVLPERILEQKPNPEMLQGEIMRITQAKIEMKFDERWRLAIYDLSQQIKILM
jgi:hypothetical protein